MCMYIVYTGVDHLNIILQWCVKYQKEASNPYEVNSKFHYTRLLNLPYTTVTWRLFVPAARSKICTMVAFPVSHYHSVWFTNHRYQLNLCRLMYYVYEWYIHIFTNACYRQAFETSVVNTIKKTNISTEKIIWTKKTLVNDHYYSLFALNKLMYRMANWKQVVYTSHILQISIYSNTSKSSATHTIR